MINLDNLVSKIEGWLMDVKYANWDLNVKLDGDRPYLQVGFWEADHTVEEGSAPAYQTGRKWVLSPHMTKSEVIQTAFKAIMTAEEHETREKFKYKGRAIFGPYFNVDDLVDICARPADVRTLQAV